MRWTIGALPTGRAIPVNDLQRNADGHGQIPHPPNFRNWWIASLVNFSPSLADKSLDG
jgi:hypothetical protein